MKKGDYFDVLLRSPKTVFSLKEISILWGELRTNALKVRVNYYLKKEKLVRLRQGLYTKNKDYNPFELASKIYIPAYISFETVLALSGIIFQHYKTIFVASYLSRHIKCDKYNFSYKRIKNTILVNPLGIENKNEYSIASPERAFLDTMYINKNYYFDNLSNLDWDKVFKIIPIYENKRMSKMVEEIYKKERENQ